MIKELAISNFKSHPDSSIMELGKINLFAGANSSGKSSILQPLLLVNQTIIKDRNSADLFLNGENVSLGTFSDVSSDLVTQGDVPIKFIFQYQIGEFFYDMDFRFVEGSDKKLLILSAFQIKGKSKQGNFDFVGMRDEDDSFIFDSSTTKKKYSFNLENLLPTLTSLRLLFDDIPEFSTFLRPLIISSPFKRIFYVGASRIANEKIYPVGTFVGNYFVGADGKYVASALEEVYPHKLENGELSFNGKAATKGEAIEQWMRYIFDDSGPSTKKMNNDFLDLSFGKYSTRNVGFGLSYTLPIVVQGVISPPGSVFIVENPEAHLSPRAQSKLIEFLCRVTSGRVQVCIESHSDHSINSLRVAVKKGSIASGDVRVFFVKKDLDGISRILPLNINEKGGVSSWPEGFFDQLQIDMDTLYAD